MAQVVLCLQRAWPTDSARAQLERRCSEAGEWHHVLLLLQSCFTASSLVVPALMQQAMLKVWVHQFVQATNSSLKAWEAGVLQGDWRTLQEGGISLSIPGLCHWGTVGYSLPHGMVQAKPGWGTWMSSSTAATPPWSITVPLSCWKWQKEVQVSWLARKKIFHIKHGFFWGDYLQWEGETSQQNFTFLWSKEKFCTHTTELQTGSGALAALVTSLQLSAAEILPHPNASWHHLLGATSICYWNFRKSWLIWT